MKAIYNWRYYVMTALFAIGMICLMAACGEPSQTMSSAKLTAISWGYFAASMGCFYTLHRLTRRWDAEGSIPEISNLKS